MHTTEANVPEENHGREGFANACSEFRQVEDIFRKRLHDKYTEVLLHKLTLVAAPSGYGKTLLLRSWFQGFEKHSDIHVDWVDADRLTDSFSKFWGYFSAVLHLPVKKAVFKKCVTENEGVELVGIVADAIMSTLPKSHAKVVVIDNFDAIKDEAIKKSFFFLIQLVKRPIHFIISTESSSLADFLGLKTQGDLFELTPFDLAFTLDETKEYLDGRGLSQDQCKDIHEITEGWPLGIRFASRTAMSRMPAGAEYRFDGSNRDVDDFFTAYSCNRLPKGTIKFLIEIAVVSEFSASLCEAITGISDGQSMLIELDNKMAYIVPLDYERKWYRFNRLFLSWLRSKLPQRFTNDQVRDLAHRASAWYDKAGKPTPAAKYAIIATGIPTIAKFVDKTLGLSETREGGILHDLISLNSDDAFVASPEYCLFAVWAYIHQGRPEDALNWVDRFQALIEKEPSSYQGVISYELVIEIVRGICSVLQHDYERGIPKVQALYNAHESKIDYSLKSILAHTLAEAFERVGQFDAARERYVESIVFGEYGSSIHVRLYGLYELGGIEVLQGRLDEGLKVFESGLSESKLDFAIRGAFHNSIARIQMERMNIGETQRSIEESLAFLSEERNVDLLLESYITRTEFQLLQSKPFEASSIIFEALRIMEEKPVPRHIGLSVTLERGRVALRIHHISEAKKVVDDLSGAIDRHDVLNRLERELLSAEVCGAEGEYENALQMLSKLERIAAAKGFVGQAIRISIQQARVLEALGKTKEAMVSLDNALKKGAPQGFVKAFYDGGPTIKMLLQKMFGTHKANRFNRAYKQKIFRSFDAVDDFADGSDGGHIAGQENPLLAALTKREKEVLKLLSYGMSKKEIAESLVVSINTAKTHVTSIYTKLGIHNSDELFDFIKQNTLN